LLLLREALVIIGRLVRQLLHVLLDSVDHLHPRVVFFLSLLLRDLNSVVAATLHVVNFAENLTTWVFLILLVHVALVVLEQVFGVVLLLVGRNFTLSVVVEDENAAFIQVELSLLDLTLSFVIRVQRKLLRHLFDAHHSLQMVIMQNERP